MKSIRNGLQRKSSWSRLRQVNYRAIKIDTGKNAHKVYFGSRPSGAGAVSVRNTNTAASYGVTSAQAKVILIIEGNSTTLTDFEIFQGDSDGAATVQLEDFPSISLWNGELMTSKVLTLASGKHLTVRPNTGTMSSVTGYIIE